MIERSGGSMDDLISRKAVFELLDDIDSIYLEDYDDTFKSYTDLVNALFDEDRLPSAQPETHDKRTKTHSCDCISRQDAISAFWELNIELRPSCIDAIIDMLKGLPSLPSDMSGYSDRLWRNAYERGKAEALDEIVRCKGCKHWSRESSCDGFCSEDCMRHDEDFYCGYAERKTDGN